ncbi:hypothetical protein MVES1_000875 [Malassezia vespertilionis]|uniref:Vps9p n=1 Tax=Malassezia vespertilionis TaxID=2020962 RepID=A0A2N1JE40_9BASI|nr:uncharacterized protein MVES1_000875 [Malassezia vespertilionis]PKI84796.1 hypothetical protein MVES_000823 [Malassezia vespertilionis]WFD05545.1 hypothetical protein MVES1_000875 [Malassezia vespertilionis]
MKEAAKEDKTAPTLSESSEVRTSAPAESNETAADATASQDTTAAPANAQDQGAMATRLAEQHTDDASNTRAPPSSATPHTSKKASKDPSAAVESASAPSSPVAAHSPDAPDAPTDSSPPSNTTHEPSAKSEGKAKAQRSEQLRPPPPEPPRPFDFNRFLEQMKHPSAVPINEYVRSFFRGFTKRPYKLAEQVKLIFDFLDFITDRMARTSVWLNLPPSEFEHATEAMEKLVMNRLYPYTFSPAIALEGRWGVQTNDLERDEIIAQRIQLFDWVNESHLDVPHGAHSARFYDFAVQELNKVNQYKAPRDKIICILNSCKVIFGLIRHLGKEENADAFVPLLILVVLKANPAHLVSNVEYIMRFKNPARPSSEADYYISTLCGAISFIESMDHNSLSHLDQAEFDANVEQAAARMNAQNIEVEKSSFTASFAAASIAEDTRAFLQRTSEAARDFSSGLGRPMGALGKLIAERIDGVLLPDGVPMQGVASATSAPQGVLPAASLPRKTQVPETPAVPAQARPPTRGVAPNAPLRNGDERDVDSDESDALEPADGSSPHLFAQTPAKNARPTPQWRSGYTPRFLAERDEEGRESPSHHVAAAQRADQDSSFLSQASVDYEAGTQTLKSIFPQTDDAVLLLLLQESNGNVETAIDRVLEMS